MLKGVNDNFEDARRLVYLLKNIPCSVNLIAFNPWEGSGFECSDDQNIKDFSEYLYKNDISAPIRWSKGGNIKLDL